MILPKLQKFGDITELSKLPKFREITAITKIIEIS